MPDLLLYLLIGAVALLIGGGAGFWIGQTRGRSDAAKSDDLQRELDAYREQVSEHFGKTAEHFQALGVQVRELYDHMAVGAETLVDPAKTEKAIAFSATEVLQPPTANESVEETVEPEAEAAPIDSGEPEPQVAAESPSEEAVTEPEESSFTVAAPEEDDPDKRSYH